MAAAAAFAVVPEKKKEEDKDTRPASRPVFHPESGTVTFEPVVDMSLAGGEDCCFKTLEKWYTLGNLMREINYFEIYYDEKAARDAIALAESDIGRETKSWIQIGGIDETSSDQQHGRVVLVPGDKQDTFVPHVLMRKDGKDEVLVVVPPGQDPVDVLHKEFDKISGMEWVRDLYDEAAERKVSIDAIRAAQSEAITESANR